MEFTFSQLKQKEVINLSDGKNLGKVCDLTFNYPDADILGITVTGGRGFRFTREDLFIPIRCVVKIGEDTVLVKREEKDREPPPPKCPPKRGQNNCPPPQPPPPQRCPPDRRSYDEYE